MMNQRGNARCLPGKGSPYACGSTAVSRYGDVGPGPKGSVMTIGFELDGQTFTGLNGGPMFTFTEAISMIINCQSQAEVDHYWARLGEGSQPGRCGWLQDK